MTHPSLNDAAGLLTEPDPRSTPRRLLAISLATLLVCGYAAVWTCGTEPILGDEARHFRHAVNCYEASWPGIRVTHDPAYPPEGPASVLYWGAALWHVGLALVWKVLGTPSLWAAQIYHTVFFFALGLFTYLCGRDLYGHRGGVWAWVLVMTVPMNLLFAMTFYLEIPVLAFAAAAFYCLLRRRAVLLGLALAGMYLTKHTTASVLIPPTLAAALLIMGDRWKQRLGRVGLAIAVMLAAAAPDLIWETVHFGQPIKFRHYGSAAEFYPAWLLLACHRLPVPDQTSVPMIIFNLRDDLQMFGIGGLVALGWAVAATVGAPVCWTGRFVRARLSKGSEGHPAISDASWFRAVVVCGLPLLFYLVAYTVMLRKAYDVRYLEPVTLPAGLLLAGAMVSVRPFWRTDRWRWPARLGAAALLAVCAVQLAAAPVTVHARRQLPEKTLAAYRWIRRHTEPEARFLYLEENLTTLTGRPIFWAAALPRLFFTSDESIQARILMVVGIDYIAVHPTRRGPPAVPSRPVMAYPRDWIATLDGRPYLELVYPPDSDGNAEGEFLIYRVRPERMPRAWRKAEQPETPVWPTGTDPQGDAGPPPDEPAAPPDTGPRARTR
ncbi:MAG: glycosyltransferase family 39 protein [Phycisphaerae bacterium]